MPGIEVGIAADREQAAIRPGGWSPPRGAPDAAMAAMPDLGWPPSAS
jgi:hypothetical protein